MDSTPINSATRRRKGRGRAGMTLVETTLVILLLLGFVSFLFVATRGWIRAADRSKCIMNLHQVQKAVRGLANLNRYEPGQEVAGLPQMIFGPGKFIEGTVFCPAGGVYHFGVPGEKQVGERIPEPGELYMWCTLRDSEKHRPDDQQEW